MARTRERLIDKNRAKTKRDKLAEAKQALKSQLRATMGLAANATEQQVLEAATQSINDLQARVEALNTAQACLQAECEQLRSDLQQRTQDLSAAVHVQQSLVSDRSSVPQQFNFDSLAGVI